MQIWLITRDLTSKIADSLDVNNLKDEKESNYFEAIKIRNGFQKIGIEIKIFTMDELRDLFLKDIPQNIKPHVMIIRCMMHNRLEIEMLNMLHNSGIIIVNNPISQLLCQDKSLQYKRLKNFGIPIPTTVIIPAYSTLSEINSIIKNKNLSFPLVVKPNGGSRASTVFKCYDISEILECIEKINILYPKSKLVILQQWIDHRSKGVISVLTLGENIIGAQQRTANREIDFFISNYRKDCNRCIYDVTDELIKITLSAVKCIGNIEMSRLDIFHDGEKYLIGEVNSPGSFISYDLFMDMDCGLMIAKYILEKYKI